ncbi:MAG: glycosyltransferase family 2 protein [Bacteroidales bacterium]|uniref:glycosyltransferase family 2 protein n=1 Tax=Porphyromonas sp. TaxID=1924944 RepID=UPI0029740897|nr:glycosyltransferase family 2 protein [Porphyromonas sp.]MDD7437512.1 glycosyltransferase family 2 protein [Bacteroidales bacterium]MDY3066469.1 glycosyltransferase family 2 protein [Porphyromonas sp.]
MQGTKRISVVTICYNAYEELQHTLKSVAVQDYPHIEYIVVDGASKDDSHKLFEEYRAHIDVLISEPDNGIYDAMNKGIKVATGDYICFMNAGDTFHSPITLSKVFAQVGDNSPDIIYGETDLVDVQRNFIRHRRLSAPQTLTKESFLRGMLVCHQSFYPRRDLVPLYNLSYRFSSDYDWCIRILEKSRHNHNAHLVLTDYLSEGVTTQNHRASLLERFHVMRRHYGFTRTLLSHLYIFIRSLIKR